MSKLATRIQSRAIRDQMQAIRSDLPYAMDEARHDMKRFSDWKYYVRKLPLTSVSCTALLAYSLVPRKKYAAPPRRVEDDAEPEVTFFSSLLGAATAMALRTGTSLALRAVTNGVSRYRGS